MNKNHPFVTILELVIDAAGFRSGVSIASMLTGEVGGGIRLLTTSPGECLLLRIEIEALQYGRSLALAVWSGRLLGPTMAHGKSNNVGIGCDSTDATLVVTSCNRLQPPPELWRSVNDKSAEKLQASGSCILRCRTRYLDSAFR